MEPMDCNESDDIGISRDVSTPTSGADSNLGPSPSPDTPRSQMNPIFSADNTQPQVTSSSGGGRPPRYQKRTELKSKARDHFEKIEDSTPPKARCCHCKSELFCDSKKQGTSSLLYHLKKCRPYLSKERLLDDKQVKLAEIFKKGESREMGLVKYNEKRIKAALLRMIIMDELPFRFVEGQGFKDFVRSIEPRFPIPSRITIMRDCLDLFIQEKERLRNTFINTGQRVCLTTDMWTSIQNLNYMVITAHFVDSGWNLHKRILNFIEVPNHQGITIERTIESCLLEWGIDSIFTITVDNASANDVAVDYMKMRTRDRVGTILDNEYMHMRCCAHILNLVVSYGLKEVNDSIVKVRNAVKYLKASPSRLEKFKLCVERQKIPSGGLLCLDVPTRWNSTYLMLDVAQKYQSAFDLMQEDDSQFIESLTEVRQRRGDLGPPNDDDWETIKIFVKFLKIFHDVTVRISGSLYATANLYFQEIYVIYNHLQQFRRSDDYMLSIMTEKMMKKYDKYWGDFEKVNMMLFVAGVLDPRYKMEFLEFWFDEIVGTERANELIQKLRNVIDRMFNYYAKFGGGSSGVESSGEESNVSGTSSVDNNDIMLRFRKFRAAKGTSVECKSEVDRYLTEEVESRGDTFDILIWWRVNSTRYPILAEIARDILAIPISTIASESAFSTGCRILDPFRSSLAPKTVEALICTQNWLKSSPTIYDSQDVVDDVESYQLESEVNFKHGYIGTL